MQHATCTLPDCGKPHEALGMMRDRIDLLEKAIEYLNGGVRS